ncbi:uncharacterized protein LY89DRAFT_426796 [Mollisia scopiformis]|uniref:S-adenosylmethionine-dependent methyltransferase-like protein n=1 Tax=Mollisia scopiformis TaxID=149040 RepID=A0A194XLU3_MOLSC|nr:uncharacterized protein LY89DRAFT_426796 [Mollisia scopiformis]KUJ21106.1 hypothetical protein LY89DRAFT_426796 [Mollisia scopiformis]
MPSIFTHKNRSKQVLNDRLFERNSNQSSSGGQNSGAASPNFAASDEEHNTRNPQHQGFVQQPSRPEAQQQDQQQPSYNAPNIVPDIDYRVQQKPTEVPTRSQSTRYSTGYQQPPAAPPQSGSSDDLGLNSRRYQQQGGAQTLQAPAAEPKNKKSIFDRMRSSGRSSESKPPSQASYNNTTGLARRLSKKENPPVIRTAPHSAQRESGDLSQRADWQFPADSRSHLPSPQEANEDGLDPYLIRESEPVRRQSQAGLLKEEIHQQPTIRPVQSEPEPPIYTTDEDRQQFEAQQLREQQIHHQASESSSQIYYQPPGQPHLNISPTSLDPGEGYRQQNPETVSQLSAYESPTEPQQEQRPVSVQSQNGQSPTAHPQAREYPNRTTSIPPQGPRPLSQHLGSMAPPPGAASVSRRAPETKTSSNQGQGQSESRDGPPPNYSRGAFPTPQPPTPGMNPAPAGASVPPYRGGPPQRGEQYAATEQGRSTPPPAPSERDVNDAYKELLTKYKKVKGLYFDKTAQVEQLQNTLANQRLSQSRTSLDDSEYMTRFQRLDGAITNLAFNIRKEWRSVPNWLSQYVNQDAIKIGKQEMTAVGRACITKFLVEEIFTNCFHPGLEGGLSADLKNIEQNIRRFSPQLNNQEESDALTAKVLQWRLATLDGLKDVLSSPESEEHKKQFSRMATANLSANLINYLSEPVPAGIEDSAHMIVELAVSVASNLPLESRDISIVYPMPGDMLQPSMMKVESQIPVLETSISDTATEGDTASTASADKDENEKGESKDGKLRKEKPKTGMLQAMMGSSSSAGQSRKGSVAEPSSEGKKAAAEDGAQKVRFAGFVGVEVRGRQVLVKAPVWTVA